MTPWPKPWGGIQPIVAWMNRLLRRCQEEQLLESKDFRRVQTAGGYYIEAKSQPAKPGSPGAPAEIKMFAITSLGQRDFFTAQEITTLQNDVPTSHTFGSYASSPQTKIAKPPSIRRSITSDTIDGIVITYRDAAGASPDNNRIANDGKNDESQCLYPRYVAVTDAGGGLVPGNPLGTVVLMTGQSVIYAMKLSNGAGVYDFSVSPPERIDWIEITPARVWAKRFLPLNS